MWRILQFTMKFGYSFIFIWSGLKVEPKQWNNNRANLKNIHRQNTWNRLFKVFYCFAPFTYCAMAFLLFTPILTHSFLNSSLHTLAFLYPWCALCNNSFATFILTMLLLTIAVLRQLLACDTIYCVTKKCSSAFFSTFSIFFSFLSILLLVFSACLTVFHYFSSFSNYSLFLLHLLTFLLLLHFYC